MSTRAELSVETRGVVVPEVLLGERLVVLTGAGLSTDSGIPDYRGPVVAVAAADDLPGVRQRTGRAAALLGAQPPRLRPDASRGAERRATGRWPRLDPDLLITQNVDGLHEAAGSRRLVALHGRIADVVCLSCRRTTSRARLEERLALANPGFAERHRDVASRPDGDVDLDDTDGFVVPDCDGCGGVLKPDVVFFGENVPPARVQQCYDAVDALTPDDALLVVGSSLTVMSGFRFVRRAARAGVPVVIVNRGDDPGRRPGDGEARSRLQRVPHLPRRRPRLGLPGGVHVP